MAKPYRNHLAKSSGRKIRVFDLEPAPRSSSDRISGALREIPLDGRRRYDALSYVWGRDKQIFDVHCGEVTLSVTQNCHDALKRLRDTTRTRTLWIDTICINQSDDDEKSHQVAMMLDIYRNADRVYIWLGEGTHGSDYALDWCLDVPQQVVAFINTMFKITPYEYSGIWRGRERPNHILGIILKRKLQLLLELTLRFVGTAFNRFRPAFSKHRAYYMQDIFAREWFTRMWTVQELAMAKEPCVMCGKKVVKWKHLVYEIFRAPSRQGSDEFIHILESVWAIDRLRELSKVQTATRGKIEKSLGNSETWITQSKIDQVPMTRNFSRLLSVALFCYAAIKGYLRHGFRLWSWEFDVVAQVCVILSCVSFLTQILFPPGRRDAVYMENDLRNDLISILNRTRARNASEPRDKVFALFGLLNELGIKMDEPDYAESKASVFFNFTRSLVEWHNSLDILIEASFPAPPGSPTWVPDWSRPYSRPCVGQYNAAGSSQPNFKINHHELETSGKVLGEVDAVFQKPTLSSASPILSFVQFETRKWKGFGWGGLGPSSMQSGDILALISGLCVPMLLRPSRQSDFEVIGLAIVDGIMQGEAWPGNASQLDSFKLV